MEPEPRGCITPNSPAPTWMLRALPSCTKNPDRDEMSFSFCASS